jgi:hypothetical protein
MTAHPWEVRVRGTISSDLLADLRATNVCEEPAHTVVHTEPLDQAGLHAILRQMRDLGLDLLEVRTAPGLDTRRG